jgi:alpha,alpha-trehalase
MGTLGSSGRAADPSAAAALSRELASAAESGWDFSTRWMAGGRGLAHTATTRVGLRVRVYCYSCGLARACAGVRVAVAGPSPPPPHPPRCTF